MTSLDTLRDGLAKLMGWDRELAASVAAALAGAATQDEADEIVRDFIGGNAPAKALAQQYHRGKSGAKQKGAAMARGPPPVPRPATLPAAAHPLRPSPPPALSDAELRAAYDMGVNVKTTVKRSARAPAPPAAKRELARKVVNCLSCGKVFRCGQPAGEALAFLASGGVCTFCGKRVRLLYADGSTNDPPEGSPPEAEAAEAAPPAGASSQPLQQSGPEPGAEAAAEASALRDRLVQYDREGAKRTAVYDDQADYFSVDSNAWLSEEERAELKRRERELAEAAEERRRRVTVTVDLLGRRVLLDSQEGQGDSAAGRGEAAAAAIRAASAEAPQGGGAAARDVEAAASAETRARQVTMAASPSMVDAHYVFLPAAAGAQASPQRAQRQRQREERQRQNERPPRLQDDDPFELAAAELAELMAGWA